ncbi:MlaD family protein [Mycobacterium syngnathidarum]
MLTTQDVLTRFVTSVMVLAVAVAVGGCGADEREVEAATRYCAIMPDSVGLYVGNPVTQMGYPIGTVERVTPDIGSVRVDFVLTEHRQLPEDVKAVTRSPSILADRSLELVGNYNSGSVLRPDTCISLKNSSTPKSLSQIIGSASAFVDSISNQSSSNIEKSIAGLDQLANGQGGNINELVTRTSALVDNPDGTISDLGMIVSNSVKLTALLREMREPLKSALMTANLTTPHLNMALIGLRKFLGPLAPIILAVTDLEVRAGDLVQTTVDTVGVALGKLSPHANTIAHLLDPIPWWINAFMNHANNHEFNFLSYRPIMYRIPTHDGLALCGVINSSAPGSCADVGGQPYAVDVNLLQYVFSEAARQ